MSGERNFVENMRGLLYACDLAYPPEVFIRNMLIYGIGLGASVFLVAYNYSYESGIYLGLGGFASFEILIYAFLVITAARRIAVIEEVLPDFLNMVSSNIRSGLTYDRALLLSSRKEFGPLAREIDGAAKETLTGKPITEALMGIAARVDSKMLSKTMRLIVEGVNSGGDLADLLEKTSLDIRRFESIRKEVSATVLVYQLFIFSAIVFGAPLLYAVVGFLIRIISTTREKIGAGISPDVSGQLPFFVHTSIISVDMIFWFSIAAIIITGVFGSFAAGVISKGKESEGFAYVPVILGLSLGVFFITKFLLETMMQGVFFS